MKSVQLGNLKLDIPIIQGGMGIGVSLGKSCGSCDERGRNGCHLSSSAGI
jgi:NAD(P)H-dependent flavin oxidoreductase YrpB (nitropropane dioxygenase family)